MSIRYPSGSEWRKWDLHVHTPIDHEWINRPDLSEEDSKKQFAKKYVDFAVQENIEVIAITDHNFCNATSELLIPYIAAEAKKKNITILPGFEITVKDGSGIHLLVIFRENTDLQTIYEVVKRLFPVNTQLIQDKFVPVSDKSIDELKDVLNESTLDYVLAFAHGDRENGILNKATIDGVRRVQEWHKKFVGICQLSKSPKEFTQGFLAQVINKQNEHYKRDIAYICASDCRTIEKENVPEGRHYLGQKFTWIKADPTLEGLKEILYEYELRVAIQERSPANKIPYEVIDEVRFVVDNAIDKQRFTPTSLKLNADLNVVIGGKSSGKSLLLYSIANTIDPKQVFINEDGPDERKRDKYGLKKDNIDFEVKWKNGTTQLFSSNNDLSNSNYSILYIPQSYIQKLADTEGKKTRKEVGKIIRNILLQKEEYGTAYKNFVFEVKRLDASRENFISTFLNALDAYKLSLDGIKSIGDKNAIAVYISQLKAQIEELKSKSSITNDDLEKYSFLRQSLQSLDSELFDLKNDKQKIELYSSDLTASLRGLLAKNEQLVPSIKNTNIRTEVTKQFEIFKSLESFTQEFSKHFLDAQNGIMAESEGAIKAKILSLNEQIAPISKKFIDREEVEKIEGQIQQEYQKLDRIAAYENDIKVKEEQKDKIKTQLFEEYKKTYVQYVEIVKKLNERSAEIAGLVLKGSVKFYTKRFEDRLNDMINKRSSYGYIEDHKLYNIESNIHEVDIEKMIEKMEIIFQDILEGSVVFKTAISTRDALNALFKDDFFDYWEIISGNDEIANMSPGKAGLVLLKLLIELSDSKCPILIDQPEDNLDNRSIYTDLVKYIREKKVVRQFIVVTHNPNIVVGADADNVIVANQNDQDPSRQNEIYQFDYTTGSLEYTLEKDNINKNILTSMGIREHVTDILEGGKEAFQKRESKYRYDV